MRNGAELTEGNIMGSWEPVVTDDQMLAWMDSFHERHKASPFEVLNGLNGVHSDAAYAEAHGAWLAGIERRTGVIGRLVEDG